MTEFEKNMILRNQALILSAIASLLVDSFDANKKIDFANYLSSESKSILDYVNACERKEAVTE